MSQRYRQFQLRLGALSGPCTNSSYWCAGGMYILAAFLPLRATAPRNPTHDGAVALERIRGLRIWSSRNGSGCMRPRRGCANDSCAARPRGPAPVAAVVLALGKGLMQQDHQRRPPNAREGQVRASVRPPTRRRPGRNSARAKGWTGWRKGSVGDRAGKAPIRPQAKTPPSAC